MEDCFLPSFSIFFSFFYDSGSQWFQTDILNSIVDTFGKLPVPGFERIVIGCTGMPFIQKVFVGPFHRAFHEGNALAFYLMNGSIESSQELSEAFYSCTTCQACTYFCPAQIKVDEIVEGVRKKLYQDGLVPDSILGVRDNILKTGNVYASEREARIDIYPPALKEKAKKGELKIRAETLLFMGCVPSYLDMKMVPSLIKPLDAAGKDYTTLSVEENCCGFPLYLMGSSQFKAHAGSLMERIKQPEPESS